MNSWTGEKLVYKPIHNPWKISMEDPLTTASIEAYEKTFGHEPKKFDFGISEQTLSCRFLLESKQSVLVRVNINWLT